ncbi:MAG: XRE family transcriptional regulator [bacterium]|nr:XRE family transcriptional regulator [bacterium]
MNNKIGERIRRERELAGLNQKELSKKAGITNYQTLLKMERGERRITIKDISAIAKALNLTADYFICTNERPSYPVLWKGMKSRKECRVFENKLTKYTDRYFHLNDILGIKVNAFHPLSSREFSEKYSPYLDSERINLISKLAEDFIRDFNLGDYPADSLMNAITEKGIIVFSFKMYDAGLAACYVSNRGASILLNKEENPWSIYCNICHEIYHILTWGISDFKMHDYSLNTDDIEEKFADEFAARLLIPETTIRREMNKLESTEDFDDLLLSSLAVKFKVPTDMLLERIESLKLVERKRIAKMRDLKTKSMVWKDLIKDCLTTTNLQTDEEYGMSYIMLAYSAWKKGKLTKMKMAEYLNKNVGELDYFLEKRGLADEQHQ